MLEKIKQIGWRVHRRKPRLWWRQLVGVLCIALVGLCFWLDREQDILSDKMIRLHVLANSDTPEDQALKLQVRDCVLAEATALTGEAAQVSAAAESLREGIPALEEAAQQAVAAAGYSYPVSVTVEGTWFPTRQYEGFSLPAGEYEALRVIIGEGAGQNWWCVVFPPLCMASSTEDLGQAAAAAGLSEEEVFLILEEEENYVIKFRAMEWWEEFKHVLE